MAMAKLGRTYDSLEGNRPHVTAVAAASGRIIMALLAGAGDQLPLERPSSYRHWS